MSLNPFCIDLGVEDFQKLLKVSKKKNTLYIGTLKFGVFSSIENHVNLKTIENVHLIIEHFIEYSPFGVTLLYLIILFTKLYVKILILVLS